MTARTNVRRPSPKGSDPLLTPVVQLAAIDHVVLRCARFDETLAFYRDVLGCTLERSLEDIGLYQLRAGDSLVDLVPVGSQLGGDEPPDQARGNMAHVCFRVAVADFDPIREQLAARGIESEPAAPRYGATGVGPSLYLSDPEGNRVELKGLS